MKRCRAVDHRDLIGKDAGRALKHGKRRQRLEIGLGAGQAGHRRCWNAAAAATAAARTPSWPHARGRQALRRFGRRGLGGLCRFGARRFLDRFPCGAALGGFAGSPGNLGLFLAALGCFRHAGHASESACETARLDRLQRSLLEGPMSDIAQKPRGSARALCLDAEQGTGPQRLDGAGRFCVRRSVIFPHSRRM